VPASGSVRLNLAVSNEKQFTLQWETLIPFSGKGILEQVGTSGENIESGTDALPGHIADQGAVAGAITAIPAAGSVATRRFETEGFHENPTGRGHRVIAAVLS